MRSIEPAARAIRGFRRSSDTGRDVYDVEPAQFQSLLTDDIALLKFAARYLKQVLFGETTIPEKPDAIEKRKKRREEIMAQQRERCASSASKNTTCRAKTRPKAGLNRSGNPTTLAACGTGVAAPSAQG